MDAAGKDSTVPKATVKGRTQEALAERISHDSISGMLKRNILIAVLVGFVYVAIVSYVLKARS